MFRKLLPSSRRLFALYKTPGPPSGEVTTWSVVNEIKIDPKYKCLIGLCDYMRAEESANRSALLSRKTIGNMFPDIPKQTINRLFSLFDTNPTDGKISYFEICAFLLANAQLDLNDPWSIAEFIFPICDINNNGRISRIEMAVICRNVLVDYNSAELIVNSLFRFGVDEVDIYEFCSWLERSKNDEDSHSELVKEFVKIFDRRSSE